MSGSGWWGEAPTDAGPVSVRVAAAGGGVRVILEAGGSSVDATLPETLARGLAAALHDATSAAAATVGATSRGDGAPADRTAGAAPAGGDAAPVDGEEPAAVDAVPDGPDPSRPWTGPLPAEGDAEAARRAALEVLRPLLASLPETAEVEALGAPTFRVATRSFAVVELADGCPVVRVKLSREDQARFLRDDRYRSDAETGPHGWTSLRLDQLDGDELTSFVVAGYRFVAAGHLAVDPT